MITAGISPPVNIGPGKGEPGMTLQYRDVERCYIVWRDYQVDGVTEDALLYFIDWYNGT